MEQTLEVCELEVLTLSGVALDFAVADCLDRKPRVNLESHGRVWRGVMETAGEYCDLPRYSSSWAAGGPVVEECRVSLEVASQVPAKYLAKVPGRGEIYIAADARPLVAAMRAVVRSRSGPMVRVPKALQEYARK